MSFENTLIKFYENYENKMRLNEKSIYDDEFLQTCRI